MSPSLYLFLALALVPCANLTPLLSEYSTTLFDVCRQISASISSESKVYLPGTLEYARDIYHWSSSSSQLSACTVEPGTAQDVGDILRVLGQTRTQFGVKSGGHGMNPGFSSSPGVLISMYRFSDVKYDPASQTAVIGTGLIFDDVYAALEPYSVSVLGARLSGIGVGGFVLGGGYSWKVNQYGLAIDTIAAIELVRPDGEVATVTKDSDSELFFGLKGGSNNFGIVTRITMKTVPQTLIWGGTLVFTLEQVSNVTAAVVKFSKTNTDTKASIIATYDCFVAAMPLITVFIYYDAPEPPQGLFDDFFTFPARYSDVHKRSLQDFIRSTPSNATANVQGVFHTVPILEYSQNTAKAIEGEYQTWCARAASDTGPFVSYVVEPILPTILNHSELPSAYPPTRGKAYSPLNLYFGSGREVLDVQLFNDIKTSAARIRDAAIADGQDITNAPLYPNYALFDTPLDQMYGNNIDRLGALRRRVDPSNVMGLAGGFRF